MGRNNLNVRPLFADASFEHNCSLTFLLSSSSTLTDTLEYLTYPPSLLLPPTHNSSSSTTPSPPPFDPPVPLHLLPPSLLVPQPDSSSSATTPNEVLAEFFAPYRMVDLTIPSYIDLARKLAEEKKLWKRFLEAFFVGTGRVED